MAVTRQRKSCMPITEEEEKALRELAYAKHPDGLKHCPGCQEDKPLAEFSGARYNPDGLQGACRTCNSREGIRRRRAEWAVRKEQEAEERVRRAAAFVPSIPQPAVIRPPSQPAPPPVQAATQLAMNGFKMITRLPETRRDIHRVGRANEYYCLGLLIEMGFDAELRPDRANGADWDISVKFDGITFHVDVTTASMSKAKIRELDRGEKGHCEVIMWPDELFQFWSYPELPVWSVQCPGWLETLKRA